MKIPARLFYLLVFPLIIVTVGLPQGSPKNLNGDEPCSCNGIELYGRVQFVESFPDLKIQLVESFPDIRVQFVDSFANDCGEWQIVESFPDFKVQVVESFPDLKVKLVDAFPGME